MDDFKRRLATYVVRDTGHILVIAMPLSGRLAALFLAAVFFAFGVCFFLLRTRQNLPFMIVLCSLFGVLGLGSIALSFPHAVTFNFDSRKLTDTYGIGSLKTTKISDFDEMSCVYVRAKLHRTVVPLYALGISYGIPGTIQPFTIFMRPTFDLMYSTNGPALSQYGREFAKRLDVSYQNVNW